MSGTSSVARVDDSQLLRDGFGYKHGQRKWVEKSLKISPKPEQDAASHSFSFLSCIHSKLIESLRFSKRTMVHAVGGGLPSPRITAASLQSRTWSMTGQPDLLEERMSVIFPDLSCSHFIGVSFVSRRWVTSSISNKAKDVHC